MLSAVRNFALTFLVSAIIFGLLAYVIVGFVVDTMSDPLPSGTEQSTGDDTGINQNNNNTPDSDDKLVSGDASSDDPPEDEEILGESFNILLVGTDYQPELFDDYDYEEKWTGPGFPDKRNRKWGADMIVILRVDKENRQFVFCPIPRNTRVLVDGNYMQLGDVISEKDIEFLSGKVSGLTGLKMDYYAVVSVGAISAAVDAIGSVNYYVPEEMVYSDPAQNLEINLKKGTTKITGERAEQLLRYVGYKNGNIGRMNTTVELAKAILAKFTNVTYMSKAGEMYDAVKDHVETNFTVDDLFNNIDLIFSYSKFETVTITYPGANKVHDGVNYFDPQLSTALNIFSAYK